MSSVYQARRLIMNGHTQSSGVSIYGLSAAAFCSETSSRASMLYSAALSRSHCSAENSPSMIPALHLRV